MIVTNIPKPEFFAPIEELPRRENGTLKRPFEMLGGFIFCYSIVQISTQAGIARCMQAQLAYGAALGQVIPSDLLTPKNNNPVDTQWLDAIANWNRKEK